LLGPEAHQDLERLPQSGLGEALVPAGVDDLPFGDEIDVLRAAVTYCPGGGGAVERQDAHDPSLARRQAHPNLARLKALDPAVARQA